MPQSVFAPNVMRHNILYCMPFGANIGGTDPIYTVLNSKLQHFFNPLDFALGRLFDAFFFEEFCRARMQGNAHAHKACLSRNVLKLAMGLS